MPMYFNRRSNDQPRDWILLGALCGSSLFSVVLATWTTHQNLTTEAPRAQRKDLSVTKTPHVLASPAIPSRMQQLRQGQAPAFGRVDRTRAGRLICDFDNARSTPLSFDSTVKSDSVLAPISLSRCFDDTDCQIVSRHGSSARRRVKTLF